MLILVPQQALLILAIPHRLDVPVQQMLELVKIYMGEFHFRRQKTLKEISVHLIPNLLHQQTGMCLP